MKAKPDTPQHDTARHNTMFNRRTGPADWLGTLHMDGWAGRRQVRCRVIGETKFRYLITTDGDEIQLPRSRMYLGQTAYVPKTAVTRRDAQQGIW
jgi:hypothetical protein